MEKHEQISSQQDGQRTRAVAKSSFLIAVEGQGADSHSKTAEGDLVADDYNARGAKSKSDVHREIREKI